MRTTHTLTITAICPVDGSRDVYELVVATEGTNVLPVEAILEAVKIATEEPVFQEILTGAIEAGLLAYGFAPAGLTVKTVGTHSSVETVCET